MKDKKTKNIRPSIHDYVSADKKFCEGKCDRERIGSMLVCHGCKRILLKLNDG